MWNKEIHRYIEYSLEETGNSGYFWRRGRRQDRGLFKVNSSCSCSVLMFNKDNVLMFTCKIKY